MLQLRMCMWDVKRLLNIISHVKIFCSENKNICVYCVAHIHHIRTTWYINYGISILYFVIIWCRYIHFFFSAFIIIFVARVKRTFRSKLIKTRALAVYIVNGRPHHPPPHGNGTHPLFVGRTTTSRYRPFEYLQ